MIAVTGASGQPGPAVVEGGLRRWPADRIVASVGGTEKAALAESRVRVRAGGFATPDSLVAAFAGAEQVLIISLDRLGEQALRMHHAALKAACATEARRVLYTSHMGARDDLPFDPAPDHAATEAFLADGGRGSRRCATASTPKARRTLSGTSLKPGGSAPPRTAR